MNTSGKQSPNNPVDLADSDLLPTRNRRSAVEVARDCNKPSTGSLRHWVFDYFPARSYAVPAWHQGDYLGTLMSGHCLEGCSVTEVDSEQPTAYPPLDHEYFEWTDLLEAVFDAGECFTMVELGAGFGRWSARGALAARRRGIENIRLIMVEGDPVHGEWLHEHMRLNNISGYKLFAGAVAAKTETALFIFDVPVGFFNQLGRTNPAAWYGQSLARSASLGDPHPTGETYKGRAVWTVGGDWKAIEVPTFSLVDILAGHDRVDIIDMDIQGAEGEIVPAFVDLLTARVRRLCIETHSPEVELQIRETLTNAEWLCLRDHPQNTVATTPFGPIAYGGGGLQSWINPRLY
jgi:FkbM family methyltransferase